MTKTNGEISLQSLVRDEHCSVWSIGVKFNSSKMPSHHCVNVVPNDFTSFAVGIIHDSSTVIHAFRFQTNDDNN